MKNITLSIPRPCSEKWENFSATSTGGFCQSCNKVVIDFTQMSDEEILEFFQNKPTDTCGRFRPVQLKSYQYAAPLIKPSFRFLKAGLVSALLLILSKPMLAKPVFEKTRIETVVQTRPVTVSQKKMAEPIIVKGTVVSEEDGMPMGGVNIVVQGTTIGTVTDAEGRFEISGLTEGDVLMFSFIGLKSQQYIVKKGVNLAIEIRMAMTYELMGEVAVGKVYTAKPSAAKRLWTKVKNLF